MSQRSVSIRLPKSTRPPRPAALLSVQFTEGAVVPVSLSAPATPPAPEAARATAPGRSPNPAALSIAAQSNRLEVAWDDLGLPPGRSALSDWPL